MGDHFFRVTILSKNAKYLETKVKLKLNFKSLSGKSKIVFQEADNCGKFNSFDEHKFI